MRSELKKISLLIGDGFVFYGSLALVITVRYGATSFSRRFSDHLGPFSIIFFLWVLIFYLNDLYKSGSLRNNKDVFTKVLRSLGIGISAAILSFYLFGEFFRLTPKTNLFIFGAVFFLCEYAWRSLFSRKTSLERINTAFFGSSPLLKKNVEYLNQNPQLGYDVKFQCETIESRGYQTMTDKIGAGRIRLVVVHPDMLKDHDALRFFYSLLSRNTTLSNFWNFYELIFEKVPLDELDEAWFVGAIYGYRPFYDSVKRGGEVLFSLLSFAILLPVMALIAIVIKTTSRGKVIYAQERVGKHGKIFTLYKFRTMRNGAEGPLWTEEGDRRITFFGKILRLTHLDELPQLWNLLKGEISLTGPRPERIELVKEYEKLPHYQVRHIVKPGLSGWAQVNFRPSTSLEEAREKLCYDIYYIKNRSLFLDLIIILKTIRHFFASPR